MESENLRSGDYCVLGQVTGGTLSTGIEVGKVEQVFVGHFFVAFVCQREFEPRGRQRCASLLEQRGCKSHA